MWAGLCCSSWVGPPALGLTQTCLKGTVLPEDRVWDLGKTIYAAYVPCDASFRWLYFYAEGWEKKWCRPPSWRDISLHTGSQGCAPGRTNDFPCVPQRFLKLLFSSSLAPRCLSVFSPEAEQCSLGSIPAQACSPLKLQKLIHVDCKDSQKSASLIFLASGFREINLIFHSPFCCTLSPFCKTTTPFPLQHPRSVSFVYQVSTLPTFFNVASSLSLVLEFVLSVFWWISVVFK